MKITCNFTKKNCLPTRASCSHRLIGLMTGHRLYVLKVVTELSEHKFFLDLKKEKRYSGYVMEKVLYVAYSTMLSTSQLIELNKHDKLCINKNIMDTDI